MRYPACFVFCLFLHTALLAQVFMRPVENAAAMGMGGGTIAMPSLSAGLGNEAQLGLGERLGFWVGSALLYGVTGWHTGNIQAVAGMGKYSGVG